MYGAILLPTDESEGAKIARDHALELAVDQDATLHILYVVEVVAPAASLHEMVAERMTERGTDLVESVAEEGRERGLTVETTVVEGDPAETIIEYAAEEGIDIVEMPTYGRTELTKAIVGSVTDKVIWLGDVPVLVIKLTD
jgi:nucleotide-binding universal stress UspA family protein